mmetsp:Transcript_45849/g.127253  ORF Transcript_45849/g.127253 Transcript_45849/m.127253 type:complete len:219 (-) Transcript_45849:979-1635(-)
MLSDDPCSGTPWYGLACNSDGEVVVLTLNENGLSGTIPTQLGQLTSLTSGGDSYMYNFLDDNDLTGTVPSEIGALTAMKDQMALAFNGLSGTMPSEIGQMTALTDLLEMGYNQFTGKLPTELGHLTAFKLSFDFSNQLLSGAIPTQLGRMSELEASGECQNSNTGSICHPTASRERSPLSSGASRSSLIPSSSTITRYAARSPPRCRRCRTTSTTTGK